MTTTATRKKPQRPVTADDFTAIAGVHKALSDPTRVFILYMLGNKPGMTNGEIQERLTLTQPTISHHLRILSSAGLITRSKDGVFVEQWLNAATVGAAVADMQAIATGALSVKF